MHADSDCIQRHLSIFSQLEAVPYLHPHRYFRTLPFSRVFLNGCSSDASWMEKGISRMQMWLRWGSGEKASKGKGKILKNIWLVNNEEIPGAV